MVQYDFDEMSFDDGGPREVLRRPGPGPHHEETDDEDDKDEDEDEDEEGEDEDEDGASFGLIGVATSVYDALELFGEELPDEEWLTELERRNGRRGRPSSARTRW
ncbi:hypothetical protein ABZ370_12525 [Streptomyces sp. NPDC005962]|uniref:hypothetical protein n=1 Tax=Streptomyces sp. NPDC005962 TaxID=3154466 RepID=UPI0033E18CB8